MIKRRYTKKQTLTKKEVRFCEFYVTRVKNRHSPLECMEAAGFDISHVRSKSRMNDLLNEPRILNFLAELNGDKIPSVEETKTKSSKVTQSINILDIIDRLKIEAGMGPAGEEGSNPNSRIGALRHLIDIYYKHAQPTHFVLPDQSPLQRIDFLVKSMAAGDITVELGRTLIQSIQTRMDIHAKTELITRIDDIERKLRSNSNAQKSPANVVKINRE